MSRIYAPFHIQFPLTFSVKVLEQVFSLSCNRSRTAKEFANNRKRVCEWYQCYSTLKGQTREVLGNAAVYAVQVNLCQWILTEFLEDERSEGRLMLNQLLSVCNVSQCQHLGVAPHIREIKMPDPAYKPPPTFSTIAKVAKRGAYMCPRGSTE